MKRIVYALSIILLVTTGFAAEPIDVLKQTGRAFTKVARETIPAVVFIEVEQIVEARGPAQDYNDPFGFFGDDMLRRFFGMPQQGRPQPRQFRREGAGSGFIISEDGYILTNSHVVGDATSIRVKLHDGREFEAENIGSDPRSEVAIIKIDAENLPIIPLGDSSKLEVGEWVIAVGNPFGLSETVTAGIVSALGRNNIGIADFEDFIQTDAAINPGNSGGPLLDIDGKVIGINTAIYTRSGGSMGVGFAIPINMARAIKDQLIETGSVSRGFLGVYMQDITPLLAESLELPDTDGILISDIIPDSPAEMAGIEQGDVIRKLDGQPVENTGAFRNTISSRKPGTIIEIEILRDGETQTISLETGLSPQESQMAASEDVFEKLGLKAEDVTEEIAQQLGYRQDDGAVITAVDPTGAAARTGLRPGVLVTGVNNQRVRNAADFVEAAASAIHQERIVLRVRTGRFHQYVAIPLEP